VQAQQTIQVFNTFDGYINSTNSYVTFMFNASAVPDRTGGLSRIFAMAKRQATNPTTTISSRPPGSSTISSSTARIINQQIQPPVIGSPKKIYISISICRIPRGSANYMPRVFVSTNPSQSNP
ncbi:26342_t:CDS:1, partial [Racocetra persica]